MAFRDGLGERRLTKDPSGADVETLYLRRELAAVPSFEFALRERVGRLAGFRHAYYARVRGLDRSTEGDHALSVASDSVPGIRLSALLDTAHERRIPVTIDVALCLIRQLVPAVAILHENARDASHGALGPERLIVTPNGRLVIVEYVLGSALEQLLFSRERYWTELRVALPRTAGLPRFDHLADVTQLGVTALSLILGRTLHAEEYPARIGDVVASAMAVSPQGRAEPLAAGLRGWLNRALQIDTRHSFPSAIEARAELEKVLAESGSDASPEHLDKFLARYHAPDPQISAAPVQPVRIPPVHVDRATAAVVPAAGLPSSAAVVVPAVHPVVSPTGASPVAAAFQAKPEFKTSLTTDSKPAVKESVHDRKEQKAFDPNDLPEIKPSSFDPRRAERTSRGRMLTIGAAAVMVVVLVAGGALLGARRFLAEEPAPVVTGTLVVTTNPTGAEAIVDGVKRGSTPFRLTLPVGAHKVELRGQGEPRIIPVTIGPGAQVAQYVDLPAPALIPAAHGEPSPAPTPAASVTSPEVSANSEPGWIAVSGKLEVQLFESDHLLGTSRIDRIMVPAGRHDLELVNELIGYRATRTIQVVPGKVSSLVVDVPKGTIAVNALPWAEVWIDGAKVGETPIGNLSITAGSHDVVFRHPELGEQRETVLVTLKNPVRLSVDMRTP